MVNRIMRNKDELPDILTAQQIATYLGISRKKVYELLQLKDEAGGIPCFLIGASKRVMKEYFLRWVEEQMRE